MLRVEETSVSFGGLRALDSVDLEVDAGSVTGLIGPNGPARRRCSTSSPVCRSLTEER